MDDVALARNRQAERLEEIEYRRLCLRRAFVPTPVHLAHAVGEERQFPAGGHLRIELAQTARCRVARIDERLFPLRRLRSIEALEVALQHQDLTAHLEIPRHGNLRPDELERERLDRPEIGGDVLADVAVAARRTKREHAAFVDEADREPVEFRLDRVRDAVDVQRLANAAVECAHILVRERVAEREHRHAMWHRLEFRRGGSADTLRWRIGGRELRVLALEHLELAEQRIVFRVVDCRRVERVVAVVVLLERGAQLHRALGDLARNAGGCGACHR